MLRINAMSKTCHDRGNAYRDTEDTHKCPGSDKRVPLDFVAFELEFGAGRLLVHRLSVLRNRLNDSLKVGGQISAVVVLKVVVPVLTVRPRDEGSSELVLSSFDEGPDDEGDEREGRVGRIARRTMSLGTWSRGA